jgi:hypothetical protein
VISVQEQFSHPGFKFLNLHAQGRLGDMAARGSFAKASKLRHHQIISQLSYIHVPLSAFSLKFANSFANKKIRVELSFLPIRQIIKHDFTFFGVTAIGGLRSFWVAFSE